MTKIWRLFYKIHGEKSSMVTFFENHPFVTRLYNYVSQMQEEELNLEAISNRIHSRIVPIEKPSHNCFSFAVRFMQAMGLAIPEIPMMSTDHTPFKSELEYVRTLEDELMYRERNDPAVKEWQHFFKRLTRRIYNTSDKLYVRNDRHTQKKPERERVLSETIEHLSENCYSRFLLFARTEHTGHHASILLGETVDKQDIYVLEVPNIGMEARVTTLRSKIIDYMDNLWYPADMHICFLRKPLAELIPS